MKKIMVISTHPDDESLGAGGFLLRKKAEGSQIFWLNVTDISEEAGFSREFITRREQEILLVKKAYPCDGFENLKLETCTLDRYPQKDLVGLIGNAINSFAPDCLLLPFDGDVHSDHRVVFEAGWACSKTFRFPSLRTIFMMEVLSETNFSDYRRTFAPNFYVDISDYFDKKIAICKIYESEIQKHPFPRSEESLRALATLRGSESGFRSAESFMILKSIV